MIPFQTRNETVVTLSDFFAWVADEFGIDIADLEYEFFDDEDHSNPFQSEDALGSDTVEKAWQPFSYVGITKPSMPRNLAQWEESDVEDLLNWAVHTNQLPPNRLVTLVEHV